MPPHLTIVDLKNKIFVNTFPFCFSNNESILNKVLDPLFLCSKRAELKAN